MDDREINREARKQKRLERLRCNEPRCGMCGEADDRTLEAHHIAGRKHDAMTVVLCRNCHRKVSDDQKDHPSFKDGTDSTLHAIGSFLLGLADILRIAVEKLYEFGRELIARAKVMTGEPQ